MRRLPPGRTGGSVRRARTERSTGAAVRRGGSRRPSRRDRRAPGRRCAGPQGEFHPVGGPDRLLQQRDEVPDAWQDQALLGGEVAEEGPLPDARGGGDVPHGRRLVAVVLEQPRRRVDQRLMRAPLVLFPASRFCRALHTPSIPVPRKFGSPAILLLWQDCQFLGPLSHHGAPCPPSFTASGASPSAADDACWPCGWRWSRPPWFMTAFGGTGKLDNTFSIPGSESERALSPDEDRLPHLLRHERADRVHRDGRPEGDRPGRQRPYPGRPGRGRVRAPSRHGGEPSSMLTPSPPTAPPPSRRCATRSAERVGAERAGRTHVRRGRSEPAGHAGRHRRLRRLRQRPVGVPPKPTSSASASPWSSSL